MLLCNNIGPGFRIGASGVDFVEGALDLSTIHVDKTSITITNLALPTQPFCSTPLPCTDSFTGFEFQFSPDVNVTGITADVASAADFLPVSVTLLAPNDLLVNLAGDAPKVGDRLILDISATRLPAALPLFATGLGVIGFLAKRRKRKGAAVAAA
jgi:hypothetical protein